MSTQLNRWQENWDNISPCDFETQNQLNIWLNNEEKISDEHEALETVIENLYTGDEDKFDDEKLLEAVQFLIEYLEVPERNLRRKCNYISKKDKYLNDSIKNEKQSYKDREIAKHLYRLSNEIYNPDDSLDPFTVDCAMSNIAYQLGCVLPQNRIIQIQRKIGVSHE